MQERLVLEWKYISIYDERNRDFFWEKYINSSSEWAQITPKHHYLLKRVITWIFVICSILQTAIIMLVPFDEYHFSASIRNSEKKYQVGESIKRKRVRDIKTRSDKKENGRNSTFKHRHKNICSIFSIVYFFHLNYFISILYFPLFFKIIAFMLLYLMIQEYSVSIISTSLHC